MVGPSSLERVYRGGTSEPYEIMKALDKLNAKLIWQIPQFQR